MFSVFIDPYLLMDFASSAHSDHCLSASNVTRKLEFLLLLFLVQMYKITVQPQVILGDIEYLTNRNNSQAQRCLIKLAATNAVMFSVFFH